MIYFDFSHRWALTIIWFILWLELGIIDAGLAKPAPVIETFCTDELVSRYVKLDGVVTLVDSKHAMRHLNEVKPRFVVNEAVEQVAYADRIIVNKVINCCSRHYGSGLTFLSTISYLYTKRIQL